MVSNPKEMNYKRETSIYTANLLSLLCLVTIQRKFCLSSKAHCFLGLFCMQQRNEL